MEKYHQCQKCFIKIDETDSLTLVTINGVALFVCNRCLKNIGLETV